MLFARLFFARNSSSAHAAVYCDPPGAFRVGGACESPVPVHMIAMQCQPLPAAAALVVAY